MSAAAALGAEDEVGSQQPEPLTASALARLEKHNGNHANVSSSIIRAIHASGLIKNGKIPKPAAQKHVKMELISHRAVRHKKYVSSLRLQLTSATVQGYTLC